MTNTLYIHYQEPDIPISKLKVLLKRDNLDLSEINKFLKDHIKCHFKVLKFKTYGAALNVYANTRCTWSALKPEDFDYEAFINEATERILKGDIDWLEQNFT